MWFGLQVILSCATTWVNYVATGPLQNSTHNLRFPLVLCLVFLVGPLILECVRVKVGLFRRERQKLLDEASVDGSSGSSTVEVAVEAKGPRLPESK